MFLNSILMIGAVALGCINFIMIAIRPTPANLVCNGIAAAFCLGLALIVAAKR